MRKSADAANIAAQYSRQGRKKVGQTSLKYAIGLKERKNIRNDRH